MGRYDGEDYTDDYYRARDLARCKEEVSRLREQLATAWDEGRQSLRDELARSWSIYDAGEPTPNPYRAGRE